MQSETQTAPAANKMLWAGRIISAIPVLFMAVGAVVTLLKPEIFTTGLEKMGYPPHLAHTLLIVEFVCVILYVIPQTAVLGAILLTGYLGGATATHVRIGESWSFPVIFGMVVWLGIYLRDARLRALIPLRRSH